MTALRSALNFYWLFFLCSFPPFLRSPVGSVAFPLSRPSAEREGGGIRAGRVIDALGTRRLSSSRRPTRAPCRRGDRQSRSPAIPPGRGFLLSYAPPSLLFLMTCLFLNFLLVLWGYFHPFYFQARSAL